MGEVYKAWDPSLKRHVALKVLPTEKIATEEMRRRLAREARAASALNHPNIITVYDIDRADVEGASVDFIAMELIEGETLRSLLSRSVEMPRVLNYLAQVADGMAKAHVAGLVHRDLKPENIMITSDGFAKILDFGLARTTVPMRGDGETESETVTLPGAVMGTVGYMSPEQVRGQTVDQRSDIFSFGCILYEVLTRRQPFRATSAVDTLHKIVYDAPPPIGVVDPPVSDALRRITLKCLGKDPEERYQSAKEIAIDLREIRREYESGVHASSGIATTPNPRVVRTGAPWLWIAAAVIVLCGAAWLWNQRAPDDVASARGGLEAMTIARLAATTSVQWAAISLDGRYIAHVESTPKGDVLLVRQVATGSEIEAAPADGKPYGELSFSQDSEYIRYVHDGALRQSPVLGGSEKILIGKFSFPVSFSSDGKRCAFVRDGSLFVAGSDGSDERRVAMPASGELYVRPSWSPRGDVIACTRQSERRVDAGNMWIDIINVGNAASGGPASTPTVLGERWYAITSLNWLPDGSGVAISAARRALIERQLYEITYPEGRTKRLTNDLYEYEGASVTADGRTLISRQTDKRSSIWLISPDDPANGQRMVEGVGYIRHLAVSPNGDLIYGVSSGGNSDIWRMAADGTKRKQLTDHPDVDLMPAASPDGGKIAFISDRSGQVTIWTMNADGTQQKQLTTQGRDVRPRFYPDGKSLIYNARGSSQPALHRIAVDGGKPTPIPSAATIVPAVSPDGRLIAVVGDDRTLRVISASDGSPVRSFPERSTHELRWTADSRAIAFTRDGAIYLQSFDGVPAKKILDLSPDDIVSFDWTTDGKSLVLARVSNQWSAVMLKNFR
jgi:Tol biopolymer transport system component